MVGMMVNMVSAVNQSSQESTPQYIWGELNSTQYSSLEQAKMKIKKLKVVKCQKILREIFSNFVFVSVLIIVFYTNISLNSYDYNQQTKLMFESYKDVSSIDTLWYWISNEFLLNVKGDTSADNYIKKSQYFTNDFSSILIGYPI